MNGRRLKIVRGELGLSQHEFSDALGISQRALSSYERGTSDPPANLLKHVCEKYGIDGNWLLEVEGTDYRELLPNEYDDYADLLSMGFSPDEASRWEKDQFEKYGDLIMKLSYDDRKRVVEFIRELKGEPKTEE